MDRLEELHASSTTDNGYAVCPHFSRTFSGTVGIKHCRKHHQQVPKHGESGWEAYLKARSNALRIAIQHLENTSLQQNGHLEITEISDSILTVRIQSQSKLSQQDLADLQAATKFDKKELQQWYKGIGTVMNPIINID